MTHSSKSIVNYTICRGNNIEDTSACINTCDNQSQISLTIDGLSFCRGFDYYVDVTSSQTIELGSREYPFKDLESVFIELANYHSNTYNLSRQVANLMFNDHNIGISMYI